MPDEYGVYNPTVRGQTDGDDRSQVGVATRADAFEQRFEVEAIEARRCAGTDLTRDGSTPSPTDSLVSS